MALRLTVADFLSESLAASVVTVLLGSMPKGLGGNGVLGTACSGAHVLVRFFLQRHQLTIYRFHACGCPGGACLSMCREQSSKPVVFMNTTTSYSYDSGKLP
jgi:hypothetical protein